MRALLHTLGNALLDLALPPHCSLCHCFIPGAGPLHLCADCRDGLPLLSPPCCSICGRPFAGAGNDHPCSDCLHHPPPWERARSALAYTGGCRDLIHAFKYRHRSHLRRPLALLTLERLSDFASACRTDLMLPIPLHSSRLRKRGFNQALLLAEPLARAWQLTLLRQVLRRTRATTSQTELSAPERALNVRDAFAVSDTAAIKDKRIMLVDDVLTTGATMAECSRILLQSGAAAVCCISVARATDPLTDGS